MRNLGKMVRIYLLWMPVALIFSCQQKPTDPTKPQVPNIAISPKPLTEDPLLQRQFPWQDITIIPDIIYDYPMGYRPLRLDVYRQTNDSATRPLVVFVHGGGWTTGHKRATANYENWPVVMANLAKLGFVVAAVEYRLSGEAPFPAAVQDVKSSIRFLKANAKHYGIDSSLVALWGGSAGANIAAMAAFTANDSTLDPVNKPHVGISEQVDAFIGWYGPYDIPSMMSDLMKVLGNKIPLPVEKGMALTETQGSLIYFHCNSKVCPEEVLKKASPINYVQSNLPPTLLIHGTSDALVPFSQSVQLYEKMKSKGASVELSLIDSVGHGWVGSNFELTQRGSLQAIDHSFRYLSTLLRAK